MRRPRKNYTAEEKVAILKRHLVEKTPVSDGKFFRSGDRLFINAEGADEVQLVTTSSE